MLEPQGRFGEGYVQECKAKGDERGRSQGGEPGGPRARYGRDEAEGFNRCAQCGGLEQELVERKTRVAATGLPL